jgi:hypothetical protein
MCSSRRTTKRQKSTMSLRDLFSEAMRCHEILRHRNGTCHIQQKPVRVNGHEVPLTVALVSQGLDDLQAGGYKFSPASDEWISYLRLGARSFVCWPSSEPERFGNLDTSRASWSSALSPAARTLRRGVAGVRLPSQIAVAARPTPAACSRPYCPRRDGKCECLYSWSIPPYC